MFKVHLKIKNIFSQYIYGLFSRIVNTNETITLFNNESYGHLDRIAIVSPLELVFADICLSLQEVVWLTNCFKLICK